MSFLDLGIFFDSNLSKSEYEKLDQLVLGSLDTLGPSECYKFFRSFYEKNLIDEFRITFENYPSMIVSHIQEYNFEEMCYFYYIFGKYGYLKDLGEIKQNLDILRDYILMLYNLIPRGKLQITSYYYKILEVVDINDFYMKGSWQ